MPLNPDEMTFDELEDESETADLDEEDVQENNDVEDVEDQDDNQDQETIDDLEDDDLREAFEVAQDEQEETDEDQQPTDEDEDVEDEQGEEEVEETRFVDDLASQFGLDPEDDFDSDLDDTWDDALQVARKGAETMAQKEVTNFFEQYPDLQEYAEFRVNGGDPEDFRQEVLNAPDYEDLELEGNENTQRRVVREKLSEVEGLSEEKVEDRIERYESAGILKNEAEDAKDILAEKQEQKQKQMIEQQKKKREKQEKQLEQERQEYKQLIRNSSEIAGLQIPENEKDSFESYLFEPVDEETGMTRAQKDYQEMNKEQATALYYLTYMGLDNLGDLIDNEASTKRAEQLSKKLKKNSSRDVSDKSSRNSGGRRKSSDANLEGFDLDSAIG